jgi:UPF0755 protein
MNTIFKIFASLIIIFLITLSFVYLNIFIPVNAGQYPITIEVVQGESLSSVSDKLYDKKIIKNKLIFNYFIKLTKQDSRIQVGEYTYHKPLNSIEILNKLVSGRFEYIPIIITIKEGEDSNIIIDKIYNNFKNVSKEYTREEVLEILKSKEGYLFPETYNFAPFATLDGIFKKIDEEFVKRVSEKYNLETNDLNKILIIASILEKEVPKPIDMKIVSGIIKNRLSKDMLLQMDSTLGYVTGIASLELTKDDLKLDSPYNTYKIKGLPSGPIGNPGDIAIEAAMNPDTNDFIYFLSDKDGVNHYAKTYAEHLNNRRVYLGK